MNAGTVAYQSGTIPTAVVPSAPKPLHRLREARRQEGVSLRTMAERLGVSTSEVIEQEQEATDLPLSVIYRWQAALKLPLGELLLEPGDGRSDILEFRSQMVRLMRTARSIQENSRQKQIRVMTQNLVNQLLEIMPELDTVKSWPSVGKRRRRHELGVAVQRGLDAPFGLAAD